MRFRPLPLLVLAAAAACASSPATSATTAAAAPQSIRVGGGGGNTVSGTRLDPNTPVVTLSIAAPVEDVWHFLPAAWDSLGIPKVNIDPKEHILSNGGMKVRQRLGKTPLSRYFDCGQTQIGPNADSYDLYLSVTTAAQAAGTSQTTISTAIEVAARPLNFNQEYSRCSSRGELEARIVAAIKAMVK